VGELGGVGWIGRGGGGGEGIGVIIHS